MCSSDLGICRDGGVSTRLRYRRNAWNLTVKARTDLRSMRVAQDEDVASPRASDVRVIMELNDEAFIMTPSTLYLSRQGHAGKVFGTP